MDVPYIFHKCHNVHDYISHNRLTMPILPITIQIISHTLEDTYIYRERAFETELYASYCSP